MPSWPFVFFPIVNKAFSVKNAEWLSPHETAVMTTSKERQLGTLKLTCLVVLS
jgi:hypothetical protein